MKEDKQYLRILSKALDISEGRVKRSTDLNWSIVGTRGYISTDGEYWYLYTRSESDRKWTFTKKALSFMELTQDGDDEGILRLSRMPFRDEARTVRKVIGLRPRTVMTEEGRAVLVEARKKAASKGVSESLVSLND